MYLWLILKETNVWIVMYTPVVTMAAADAGEATKELDLKEIVNKVSNIC